MLNICYFGPLFPLMLYSMIDWVPMKNITATCGLQVGWEPCYGPVLSSLDPDPGLRQYFALFPFDINSFPCTFAHGN